MSIASTIGRDILNLKARYEGAPEDEGLYRAGHGDALMDAQAVVLDSRALRKLETDRAVLLAACRAVVEACDRGSPSRLIADVSAANDLCLAAVAAAEGQ